MAHKNFEAHSPYTDTQNHFDLLATVPLHKDNSKQDVKRK